MAATGEPASTARPPADAIARVGLMAGAVAGMMMAMWQMIVGAIATEPTAVPGIDSSFWTAVTSITSFIFGLDAFSGDFEVWPVLFGVAGHMFNSMMLGIVGVTLLTSLLGGRPNPIGAVIQGMLFGLVVEVVLLNLIVNNVQDINSVYTSTPEWSWWVSHGIYGMTLGLVAVTLLRSRPAWLALSRAPARGGPAGGAGIGGRPQGSR